MRKKKLLFLTDFAGAYTGFGKQAKLLLSYLYKTNKYEIIHLAQGCRNEGPGLAKFPWVTEGAIPSSPELQEACQKDQNLARMASYGAISIEKAVEKYRPDIVFAINDTWGSQFVIDHPFSEKIPTVCWNTFDSLPLLDETIKKADKIKHYWTWSHFARDEFHKLGFNQVKTQYPLVNTEAFKKLSEQDILQLKIRHSLPLDSFIIGFVFRNQLRKLVNTQIEAYSIFKKAHPEIKNTYLYTHTNYSEGWDIPKLCRQYKVNVNEVLCTYICKETKQYFIAPFNGQNIQNPITKRNSLITVGAEFGITDSQLNEIYNLFSLYSHPATSGACELPCVEAALTEKIIATCKYSFGEDIINLNKGSLPIDFNFYTEHGTQFLKSQPSPASLADIFWQVYSMEKDQKRNLETLSREWALTNYCIEKNGGDIVEFIDSIPLLSEDIDLTEKKKTNQNPLATIPPQQDPRLWVKSLYKLILDREVADHDDGLLYWLDQLNKSVPRNSIEDYFRQVAKNELNTKQVQLKDLLDKDDSDRRGLLAIPGSKVDVFYASALLSSFKELYPNLNLYCATNPENFHILLGNKNIHKLIPYLPQMTSPAVMEGHNSEEKLFATAFCLSPTQSQIHIKNQKCQLSLK